MLLPRSCGGEEVAPAVFMQAIEEIAKADASTAWCLAQGSGSSMAAAYLTPAAARTFFGDPRAVMASGPFGTTAKAVVAEGGYRVTGTWAFASGIRHATVLGAHCSVAEPDGTSRLGADGKPVERTVLAPKASGTVEDVWHVVGLKGTGSNTYSISDLFIPEDHTFNRELAENRRESGPLYRFSTYQLYGTGFAGIALGIGRAALDAFVALACEKTPYRRMQVLRDNAVVQSQVALCEAQAQRLARIHAADAERIVGHRLTGREPDAAAARDAAACRRSRDPPGQGRGRYRLPCGRRHRDLREQSVRAPLPRRAHGASSRSRAQFSNFELVGQVLLGLPSQTKLI